MGAPFPPRPSPPRATPRAPGGSPIRADRRRWARARSPPPRPPPDRVPTPTTVGPRTRRRCPWCSSESPTQSTSSAATTRAGAGAVRSSRSATERRKRSGFPPSDELLGRRRTHERGQDRANQLGQDRVSRLHGVARDVQVEQLEETLRHRPVEAARGGGLEQVVARLQE